MVSVNSKTQTFANGTPNDAGPVDSEFVSLFNNDATLANAVTAIENGNLITATTLTINSNYTGGSPGNMAFMAERGNLPNTGFRWNESTAQWEVTNDGSAYAPVLQPTGMINAFAGTTAPVGWLLCYGQAVSRTSYAALFAVTGTAYGAGDGSTTFNLPDLRGRFALGLDNMGGSPANRVANSAADVLGGSAGAETHTLSVTEMPAHTHDMQFTIQSFGSNGFNIWNNVGTASSQATTSTGGGGAHNNMPPYLSLNYIIKT